MKIVRYRFQGEEVYGELRNDQIYKIKGNIFDKFKITSEKIALQDVRLLSPVKPPNIIAIGVNYKKHAEESGHNLPDKPVIFIKATTAVIGPGEDIVLPKVAPDEVDFEAELAIVIGKKAKNINKDEVSEYVLGYTCANDVSARDCQRRLDKQWARGKSFDTFCPIGPYIETELDPDNCDIKSRLNNKIMQDTNTSDLIFDTAELVRYISSNMTLLPGTVILTGTPEGVGFARKPAVFLQKGDIIEIEIKGIGVLSNKVIMEK